MVDRRLLDSCKTSKKYVMLTVLAQWIALVCNVCIIVWIGYFVNGIGSRSPIKWWYIVGLGICLAGRFFSNLWYGKVSALASEYAKSHLRQSIYQKLLKLGMNYQKTTETASVVQVMVDGVEQLEVYFGRYLPQLFYALVAPLTLFIVIFPYSFESALVLLIAVPLIPLSIVAIMKIAKKVLKKYWKSYAHLGSGFLENIQGLTTLKVFDQDEKRHEAMNKEAEDFRVMTMKVLSMQLHSINIMDLVAFGGAAAGTIIALIQYSRGELLIGHLIVIALLSAEFFIPMRLLGSYFHVAMNGMAAADRMFQLLDTQVIEDSDKKAISDCEMIRLEDVTFGYEKQRPILKEVSMVLPKASMTAIVGESGSGKSTVASLLMKKYKPDEGHLYWGNVSYEEISNKTLYEHLTLVSTNSYIMSTTLRDNLLMGKPDATEEEINYVLHLVQLKKFVDHLPAGLDTAVGEGGNFLSGGQRQRLALARSILANREVMIFDEATSNVDVESEEAIWEAIHYLAKTKTIVVIAHRLAHVREAQCIYVMKDGRIVEKGDHQMLYNNKKTYFEMVRTQERLEGVRKVD